jgi:hypothetical protein
MVLASFNVSCYGIVKGGANVELKLRYYLVFVQLTSVMDIVQGYSTARQRIDRQNISHGSSKAGL